MLREVSKDYITSAKPNASFSINTGSDSNYYQLKLPYQITYEFCSGTEEDDYMNAITFSEDESFYARDSFQGHDKAFHDHPDIEDRGLDVLGAVYDIETGKVEWI